MTEQEVKWLFTSLRNINLFEPFTLENIDKLTRKIEKYQYPKGKDIIKEGDEGRAFFVVYKGKVRIWKKKGLLTKTKIAELGPGSFFGEMCLVSDQPCTASVTAIEPVEVFVLFRETFQEQLNKNPDLMVEMKHIIEKRKFEVEQKRQ